MPSGLRTPVLDDRTYEEIRDELLERIPVYTPEWTDFDEADPGVTLLELFSFLVENLLFRFNQIPVSTRRRFLLLLGLVTGLGAWWLVRCRGRRASSSDAGDNDD